MLSTEIQTRSLGSRSNRKSGAFKLGQEDPGSWTAREKFLYLLAYQWLSALTAPRLLRQDEPAYEGPLRKTIDVFDSWGRFFRPLREAFSPDFGTLVELVSETTAKAREEEISATSLVVEGRALRNQIVEDLVEEGAVVEFEYFGDSPQYPGELIYHKVAGAAEHLDRPADLSALFSKKSLSELVADGERLMDKFEDLGVTFERPTLGVAFPFLAVIIVAVAGIVAIYWIYRNAETKDRVVDRSLESLENARKDGLISDETYLEGLEIINRTTSLVEDLVGPVPWDTIILGGIAIVAGVGLLSHLMAKKKEASA